MVVSGTIIQSNQRFSSEHLNDEQIVGVFAGATSGIGARTLERMTTMFRAPTFYVLGRSSIHFATQRKTIESLNPDCNIIYIETDVSLISGIDSACQQIKAAEKRVDYLYMSMGGLPLAGAQYTSEGLETCFAISYFSRMRLLFNLLPLLNQSPRPRVLSVLNGGMEKRVVENDMGLEKSWTVGNLVNHTTLFTSLTFDGVAAQNPELTLIHNAPGLVESDNLRRIRLPADAPFMRRVWVSVAKFLISVIRYFIGMPPKEAGERQTYHLTSDTYGPGSFRVNKSSEIVPSNDALMTYRESGWINKIWEFTVAAWDKALTSVNGRAHGNEL
ncbi:hypothetical protein HD806DRAFT_478368 [Xylariaceae sp. AK1471]|nr:hypothetical protein HD806DRAFT_478368 [Xylariaceae sp. AK1471]